MCSKNRIVTLGSDFIMTGSNDVDDPITCGLIVDDLLVLGSQDRQIILIYNRHTLETINNLKVTKYLNFRINANSFFL